MDKQSKKQFRLISAASNNAKRQMKAAQREGRVNDANSWREDVNYYRMLSNIMRHHPLLIPTTVKLCLEA